jgi:hypothetical protein
MALQSPASATAVSESASMKRQDQAAGPRGPRPPLLRHLWMWMLITATAVMLVQSTLRREHRTEVTYSDVTRELERDNIAGVEVMTEERRLQGEFRNSVHIDGRDVREFRTNLPFDDPAPLVVRLEQHGIPIRAAKAGPSWVNIVLGVLPWLLLGGFWFLLTRSARLGSERALSFGQMGARRLTAEQPKVTFADVAGAEEAKAELREVIDFLKDPAKFRRVGGRLPKGVLIVGPPGTGQTLLARALAGEAGVAFWGNERLSTGHGARPPHGHAVRDEPSRRSDNGERVSGACAGRARGRATAGDLAAHRGARRPRGAPHRAGGVCASKRSAADESRHVGCAR